MATQEQFFCQGPFPHVVLHCLTKNDRYTKKFIGKPADYLLITEP